jgi:hypothetical protein
MPPMFWFRDPDGNALLIVQRGRRGHAYERDESHHSLTDHT